MTGVQTCALPIYLRVLRPGGSLTCVCCVPVGLSPACAASRRVSHLRVLQLVVLEMMCAAQALAADVAAVRLLVVGVVRAPVSQQVHLLHKAALAQVAREPGVPGVQAHVNGERLFRLEPLVAVRTGHLATHDAGINAGTDEGQVIRSFAPTFDAKQPRDKEMFIYDAMPNC